MEQQQKAVSLNSDDLYNNKSSKYMMRSLRNL